MSIYNPCRWIRSSSLCHFPHWSQFATRSYSNKCGKRPIRRINRKPSSPRDTSGNWKRCVIIAMSWNWTPAKLRSQPLAPPNCLIVCSALYCGFSTIRASSRWVSLATSRKMCALISALTCHWLKYEASSWKLCAHCSKEQFKARATQLAAGACKVHVFGWAQSDLMAIVDSWLWAQCENPAPSVAHSM